MKEKLYLICNQLFVIALSFFAAVALVRLADLALVVTKVDEFSLRYICCSFIYNYISICVILSIVMVIHILVALRWNMLATKLTTIIVGVLLLAEISLDLYSIKSGSLLGVELFLRPVKEMFVTVVSALGWKMVLYFILGFASVAIYCCFVKKLMVRVKLKPYVAFVFVLVLFLSCICQGLLVKVERKTDNCQIYNFIVNKGYYLYRSSLNYFTQVKSGETITVYSQSIEVDSTILQQFALEFPNWKHADVNYPFERQFTDSCPQLASYFNNGESKPNVVFIVVESLGREWSGQTDLGVSYTPFLDSLAQSSLYWSNCLSTTKRSFGVIPSLTGSTVLGPRGFQFGNMPNHNSIFKILKQAGYQTNAFYAGEFSFDCVYEYLVAQDVDYMSTDLRSEYIALKDKRKGTYWGYSDEYLFSRSLEILGEHPQKPMFNLYVTISAHDEMSKESERYDLIIEKTKKIIEKLPVKLQTDQMQKIERIASVVYSDYALKLFFDAYSKRSDFKNTIFVITGDHAAEVDIKNRIGYYHVPLMIYSPLLNQSAKFTSLVSHLDVAPSILGLLHNKYGIAMPQNVSWSGVGLSFSSEFEANSKLLLMDYAHDIGEIVYGNYFYYKEKDALYKIDSNLNLALQSSAVLRDSIIGKLNLFKQINNYTYLNNRLQKDLYNYECEYRNIMVDTIAMMKCEAQPEPPSVVSPRKYYLLNNYFVENLARCKRLRILVSAEICIEGVTYKDKQMKLVFSCKGNKKHVLADCITNYVTDEKIDAQKWYKMVITKEFDVEKDMSVNVDVYVRTANDAWGYTPDNKLFIRNVTVAVDVK